MTLNELYTKVDQELMTEDNDKSQNQLYLENIEEVLYYNSPEKKSELTSINCKGIEISGFLLLHDRLRLTYLDFDDVVEGTQVDDGELKAKIETILDIKNSFTTIEELDMCFDIEDPVYEVYETLVENPNTKLEIQVITNRDFTTVTEMVIKGIELSNNVSIEYENKSSLESALKNHVEGDLTIDFSKYKIKTVNQDNDQCNVLFFTMPTKALAEVYDEYGTSLLQDNVRLFLSTSGVNKGIKKSLRETPELFLSYNNGLSAVCKEVEVSNSGQIQSITGLQIVNGGQTTASIYSAFEDGIDLENSYVQVKLSEIRQEKKYKNMVLNIARYANTQNKINNSDFVSAEELFVEFEKLSKQEVIPARDNTDLDSKIFFERMRGQKKIEEKKLGKKEFEKLYLTTLDIKSIAQIENIWNGSPAQAARGGEKSLMFFVEASKDVQLTVEMYRNVVARQYVVRKLEEIMEQSTAPGDRYRTSSRSKNFGPIASSIKYYALTTIFASLKSKGVSFSDMYFQKEFTGIISDETLLAVVDKTFEFFDSYQTEINMLARNKTTEEEYLKLIESWK